MIPTLDPSTHPSVKSITVIGRLAPGARIAQARAEAGSLPAELLQGGGARTDRKTAVDVAPLRSRYVTGTQSRDIVFAAIVGCVLLIACANVANLVLLRTLRQQRELAIRAALGAGTGELTRLLFLQYLTLAAGAAALGLFAAARLLRFLEAAAVLGAARPPGMDYRLDSHIVVFALLLAVLVAVALSVIPARIIARMDVQRVLGAHTSGAGGSRWSGRAQRVFVVAQIACATVLLTAGGLMTATVARLSRFDLGFDHPHLVFGSPSYATAMRTPDKYKPLTDRLIVDCRRCRTRRQSGCWSPFRSLRARRRRSRSKVRRSRCRRRSCRRWRSR